MANERAVVDQSLLSWKGELCRKGIHLLSLFMPLCYFLLEPKEMYIGLCLMLALFGVYDLLRFFGHKSIKNFLDRYFGFLIRPRENKGFSGATTIVLAGLLVYLLFDLKVAAASMIIIVIGDTSAAVIGRRFGRIKFRSKSLEGTLAFIAASALVVILAPDLPYGVAFAGVLIGALVELLPLYIDDNITVPLASGALMQMLI